MFYLNELENFEGYLNTLDRIMTRYAYYSEEDYIYNNRQELTENKNIIYTDMRNDNNHVIVEFDVLDDEPDYYDLWVKVTNYYED